MLKNMINFPNEFLDFDYIVVNNDDYFPINSFGGSVLLDRGGSIYVWNSILKKYELNIESKHLAMISENVIALCEHGGYNIPNLKLQKQIVVNFTHRYLVIDDQLIWSIDEIEKIKIVNKPFYEHDGYTDIHHKGEFIRIMCKAWQLEHFEYVAQEISLVKKLCNVSFEIETL
ncbi:hypothetical protein GRF59_18565 [Paenibacillus sp. HJL G12]|uniref:Uncharacterized protein n=1 Tax=Paenibacillus dendrobii TaxID=2691084 RepID=A0A7X3LIV8_9BACL|nr:hypothetical protein [Paenibacillus dendrobii]MWV45620.1 hypothetical protein [Paenibacillus dendrobii]